MNKMRLIESLKEIVGFQIGLYTNDGEYIEGILSEIKDDFLIIKDKKHGTFFFNIDKIQAFSKNTRKFVVDGTSVEPYYENSLMEIIDNYMVDLATTGLDLVLYAKDKNRKRRSKITTEKWKRKKTGQKTAQLPAKQRAERLQTSTTNKMTKKIMKKKKSRQKKKMVCPIPKRKKKTRAYYLKHPASSKSAAN